MNRDKFTSYMGFAARSRNLVTGYNTCILMMEKKKLQLIIISEDLSENTKKKMEQQCNKYKTEYRIFGESQELSHITGKSGKGIFGITDKGFSRIVKEEIDQIQSEREVF